MRPSLEDEDLSRIAELPITGDAAADTMRDLLTGALPASRAARCAFFTKLSAYSFRREIGTMAYALCLSEGLLVSGTDRSKPLLCHREGSVYREGFTVGLFAESFVFGYESDCDGFDTMTLDMDVSIALDCTAPTGSTCLSSERCGPRPASGMPLGMTKLYCQEPTKHAFWGSGPRLHLGLAY